MTAEQLALLFNYGILGLVVVGFLTGQIHAKSRVDREVEISDKAVASTEKALSSIDKLTTAIEAWRSVERREGPR